MRALLVVMLLARAAAADREMCGPSAKHRGAAIDLDVVDADIRDVFRLLAEVGRVNLVVADDVSGKVTLRLKHVAWDQVACTVAAVHHLRVTLDNSIVLVMRATAPAAGSPAPRPADR